jgi:hypothetical protein
MNRSKRPPRRTTTKGPGLLAGPADESLLAGLFRFLNPKKRRRPLHHRARP